MTDETSAKPRSKRRRVVLAAVAGCVLIASAALWHVGSVCGRCSRESWAVGTLRTYHGAQMEFHRNDWDALVGSGPRFAPGTVGVLEYASDFRDLNQYCDGGGNPINLISADMANAKQGYGKPYHGYYLQEPRSIGGEPIDWVRDHALCATPAKYPDTGRTTFLIRTDGVVWGKDLGKSEFVKDFPADPASEGWEKVE